MNDRKAQCIERCMLRLAEGPTEKGYNYSTSLAAYSTRKTAWGPGVRPKEHQAWYEAFGDEPGRTKAHLESLSSTFNVAVSTPSPINPLGAKGIGEGGTIGAPPTIVNAVLDALAPLGIEAVDMPLKPEKIWTLIQAARQGSLEKAKVTIPQIFETDEGMQKGGVPDFA